MMKLLAVVIVCALTQVTLASLDPQMIGELTNYDNCRVLDSAGDILLFWTAHSSSVGMAVTGRTSGWVGVGINRNDAFEMIPADAVIGYVTNSGSAVQDYYLSDRSSCINNDGVCRDVDRGGIDSLTGIGASEVDGITTIKFTRPIEAVDQFDVALKNSSQAIIWALGESDPPLSYHADRGYLSLNLLAPGPAACPIDPNNGLPCSGNGECQKGCCICFAEFDGVDCSRRSQSSLPSEIIPTEYTFTAEPSDNFKIYWKILQSEDAIEIAVECKCTGWVAFGPSRGGSMVNSDIIMGSINNNGRVDIGDYFINSRSGGCPGVCPDTSPIIGGRNSIIDSNGNVKDGVTQLKWIRKLNTGDNGGDILISDKDMDVIWGYHPTSKSLTKHNANTRGAFKINFFTGKVKEDTDLRLVHGILMFIGWAVIIPVTSILARYFKKFQWWFNLHRFSNGTAIAIVIAAFIIAIVMSSSHFTTVHSIIGLIAVIIGVSQPILGIIADRMFEEGRLKTPIFPDKVHWVLGWGSMGLALINIFLGIALYESVELMIGYGIYFAAVVAFILGFVVYKTMTRRD